ncbi:MAG: hypothetical protein JXA10_04735, partial [Anaerolineae bacterium]|nr:hypothetical protein [Anaerolineae bacterium]
GAAHSASCPVSVRHHFTEPVGMALGMMVWPYNKMALPNTPDVPFWDQARQFQHAFKRQISPLKFLLPLAIGHRLASSYPLERMVAAFDMETEASEHSVSITNLGRLALNETYGALRLVRFYGPLLDANAREVVLGVATTNGTLTCAMTFREPILPLATAEKIRAAALDQITAAV